MNVNFVCFHKVIKKILIDIQQQINIKKQQNMIKSDKIMINSDEKTLKIPQIVNEKFVYILLKRT